MSWDLYTVSTWAGSGAPAVKTNRSRPLKTMSATLGFSRQRVSSMSWTRGTNLARDGVYWKENNIARNVLDSNAPYALGTEYHIVMVIEPGGGAGLLRVGRWGASLDAGGDEPAAALSAGLPPHTEVGTDDCRLGGQRKHTTAPSGRSDPVPAAQAVLERRGMC